MLLTSHAKYRLLQTDRERKSTVRCVTVFKASPTWRPPNTLQQCVPCLTNIVFMAQGDVRKTEDAERWVRETVATFGRLDILVNCAAGNFLVGVQGY